MTSRKWSPGNAYGPDNEPKYAILSYTWGRFEKAGEPRLQVEGIDWEVPSINPTHFTVADLRRLLEQIGRQHDYVWIDIACIDQKREKEKMQEVGRQAAIFKGAQKAYVWLNKYDPDTIKGYMQTLMRCTYDFAQGKKEPREAAEAITSTLSILLEDPWFSSLWTLQESVLQRHALLMDKSGQPIITNGPWLGESPVTQLMDVSGACAVARVAIDQGIHASQAANPAATSVPHVERIQSLHTIIDRGGIDFTLCPNPNIQYSAAIFRQTSRPEDRIYAIMQVYGYRLGNSAPSIQRLKSFSLADLELQFLKSLTLQSALLSQAFQHKGIPMPGESWCIANHVRVPYRLHYIVAHDRFLSSACSIDVRRRDKAYFEGSACSIEALSNLFSTRSRELLTNLENMRGAPEALLERRLWFNRGDSKRDTFFRQAKQGLMMDYSDRLDATAMSFEWPPNTTFFNDTESIIESRCSELAEAAEKNQDIIKMMVTEYGETALRVLYLGCTEHIEWMQVAVILVKEAVCQAIMLPKKIVWRRIGIYFWCSKARHIEHTLESMQPMRGRFG
ncbi:MAG: hypothetical protein Q9200_001565 [Gallowayella weberi]